jgi:hypothetical protein
MVSSKPTSGESARFHLSDYRLVACITSGLTLIREEPGLSCGSCGRKTRIARKDDRLTPHPWVRSRREP